MLDTLRDSAVHVPGTRRCILLSVLLPFVLTDVAGAAKPPSAGSDPHVVVVEASGSVPGFTHAQLGAYLASRMHEETAASWEFLASQPGAATAPNRVVWSFRTLRTEWKGGSHKGFPSPTSSVTYLSAEVKMYLNNTYQMAMSVRPSVNGRSDDKALGEMVRNVAHSLFFENRADELTAPGGQENRTR
ncbi:MAG TPA: hypothetical protein VEK05_07650 [Burkholderiales bacterium]|nr:hypothetical protein [Burkholderiales bacterium]